MFVLRGAFQVIPLIVVAVVVLFLFTQPVGEFITAGATPVTWDDGSKSLVASLALTGSDVVYPMKVDGEGINTPGGLLKSNLTFAQIQFTVLPPSCNVTLQKNSIGGVSWYAPLSSAQKNVKFKISTGVTNAVTGTTSQGGSVIASLEQGSISLPDPAGGPGKIVVNYPGLLQGQFECGSPNIAVVPDTPGLVSTPSPRGFILTSRSRLEQVQADLASCLSFPPNVFTCSKGLSDQAQLANDPRAFEISNPPLQFNLIEGTLSFDAYNKKFGFGLPARFSGVPFITVVGDLAYWKAFIFEKPETAYPTVFVQPITANANQVVSFVVTVSHSGRKLHSILVSREDAGIGAVFPSSQGPLVGAGESKTLNFQFNAPQFQENQHSAITFKACVANEVGGSQCALASNSLTVFGTGTPTIIPTPVPTVIPPQGCPAGTREEIQGGQRICVSEVGGIPDWVLGVAVVLGLLAVAFFAFKGDIGGLQGVAKMLFLPLIAFTVIFLILSSIELPLLGSPLKGLALPIGLLAGAYAFITRL